MLNWTIFGKLGGFIKIDLKNNKCIGTSNAIPNGISNATFKLPGNCMWAPGDKLDHPSWKQFLSHRSQDRAYDFDQKVHVLTILTKNHKLAQLFQKSQFCTRV